MIIKDERWMDGQTNGWMDGWMDGWMIGDRYRNE